ncbi:hypothetical protein [Oceanisphaera arctica]|uniref:MSHA biogenesis protein MshK n=1 Tax=Oceanisphaera arctica TaxID=641510 RepID=A0A2P5TL79_9GAMM|nr:hypothetical protein [Oceanisphaera arctica]PPL16040.1 hypothetical protein UN63_10565 [Oceanisphaera arctica]GHA15294.1 hypothetical protein GCM10007082_15080 [Oceanisphaera arctica]
MNMKPLYPLSLWLLATTALADTGMPLRDPFVRPQTESPARATTTQAEPAPSFTLRALLVAGDTSLANIDGTILALGDEFDGYRLISVTQEETLFEKGSNRYRISLKERTSR